MRRLNQQTGEIEEVDDEEGLATAGLAPPPALPDAPPAPETFSEDFVNALPVEAKPIVPAEVPPSAKPTPEAPVSKPLNLAPTPETVATDKAAAIQEKAAIEQREAAALREQEAALRRRETEAREREQLRADEVARFRVELDRRQKEDEQTQYKGYWADKSVLDRVLAAVAIGLGGLGAALQAKGGMNSENQALAMLNKIVADDYAKYLDRQKKRERGIERAGDAVTAATTAHDAARRHTIGVREQIDKFVSEYGPSLASDKAKAAAAGLLAANQQELLKLKQEETAAADTHAGKKVDLRVKESQIALNRAQAAAAGKEKEEKKGDKDAERELLDREGNVIGYGRSPSEAKDTREARTELGKARVMAEDLKKDLAEGKLLWLWDSGKQTDRDLKVSQLMEARKKITGAETESDTARYRAQMGTAWNKGPEAAKASVDQFIRGLEVGYDERVKSAMRRDVPVAKPEPKAAPKPKAAPTRKELFEWAQSHPSDPRAAKIMAKLRAGNGAK